MKITIRTGGQTGVDRGAWLGARDAGLERCGWMPHDMRDELGLIPDEVRADLRPALNGGGTAARTTANVMDTRAVVIIVPDATKGTVRTAGTRLTYRLARREADRRGLHWIVTDGTDPQVHRLVAWFEQVMEWSWVGALDGRLFDLMIAGPRASLWPEGEATARRIVQRIAEVAR
jgi:hypothetical protein